MIEAEIVRAGAAALYRGQVITADDLPPRFNRRWTGDQKQRLLAAIDGGVLTAAEAGARYALSPDDLVGWRAEPGAAPTPLSCAVAAQPAPDRLARLIDVLVERGVIDERDAFALNLPKETAWNARMAEFMIDDRPLF